MTLKRWLQLAKLVKSMTPHHSFDVLSIADVTVFAKKEIPLRTKFGPVEGDIQHLIDSDQIKKHSTLPFYLIDESTYIDTSNERKLNGSIKRQKKIS